MEFALNRGQSTVGPTTITAATAGFTPVVPAGQLPFNSLARSAAKTLVVQWTMIF